MEHPLSDKVRDLQRQINRLEQIILSMSALLYRDSDEEEIGLSQREALQEIAFKYDYDLNIS